MHQKTNIEFVYLHNIEPIKRNNEIGQTKLVNKL